MERGAAAPRCGNLLSRSDARNQTSQTQYDGLDRPVLVSHADGRQTRYVWDLGVNGVGRLAQIDELQNGSLVTRQTYAYDPQGRLVRQTQSLGPLSHSLDHAYSAGRLTGLTLPSGRSLAYSRDPAGRIAGITLTDQGTPIPLVQAIAYAPHGPLQGWTDPAGQNQSRAYDLDGQVTRYTAGGQTWTLGYDAAGRLVRIEDQANPLWVADFTYDSLDRLTRAVLPVTAYSYSYDANGNRTSRTIGARVQAMAIAATSNRLLSLDSAPPVSYGYDASGNRITDNLASYTYDAAGRLSQATSSVGTTQYQVNALGLRTKKSGPLGETIFIHDREGRLIAEADGQGSIAREYVWLDDTPVAILDGPQGSTSIYAIHSDHLNTPRAVTNSAGTVVWRMSPVSEPFGLLPPEQDPDGDGTTFVMNLRFPGQYFDRETNLAYNWHRSYDAQTGGYTTSDPIGLAGGQWSTYGYVDGQPTMKVDPEGLQFVLPGGAAGGFGGLGGFGGNAGNRSSSDNDPYGGLGQYMRDGGSTSGNASNSSSSSSAQQEQCKQPCPPCKLADGTVVPIGTIGYRWDVLPSNVVQHGIAGDHLNLYEVNQNPNNCKCFWKRGPTVRPPPLPGWIPIQPLM